MTYRIDLSLIDDRRDAIHQIVETLVGGGIARVTMESEDCVLALATHLESTRRLASLNTRHHSALLVSGAEAAADFLPALSPRTSRLLQRTSTPTHLWFVEGVDERILQELPADAVALFVSDGEFRLTVPVSDVTRGVLRLLPGPAVVLALTEEMADKDLADIEVGLTSARRPAPPTVLRFRDDDWTLVEPGGLSQEDIARMMAERIVFVCTGNTCRSPMAEGVFRKLLAERLACAPESLPQHGFEIASAGVAAMAGAPASPDSVAVCADHGVDLRSHASQPLQQLLLEDSDRLYTMTAGHQEAIRYRFPEYAERVLMLSRGGLDVTDPIGAGRAAYERCFREITENLHSVVDELTAPTK